MYQNMDCVILGYQILTYAVSYKVYNSAGEQIVESNLIKAGYTIIGITIPYGGYLEITMDESHSITFKNYTGSVGLFTARENSTVKFKVVRDYVGIVNEVTAENGIETYTELHP